MLPILNQLAYTTVHYSTLRVLRCCTLISTAVHEMTPQTTVSVAIACEPLTRMVTQVGSDCVRRLASLFGWLAGSLIA